ncbi:phosphate ABC transporter permease PstA [Gephyromycinifex aptenodytis]|uniref:phosphate ABC transporter permease PstA n=1 Tax=Gephyromycinifex aptenodytis TaxID=2716227 RepID=UPI001447F7D1|nr:phosphate ABC transporter permease PstA [Gephyromycinifex aptenodytis]
MASTVQSTSPNSGNTTLESKDTKLVRGGLVNPSLSATVRAAVFGGSVVVGIALAMMFGWGFNIVGIIVLTAIVYAIAIYITSRMTEGPRPAIDRLVTAIVTTMFALAMIPLVSVIIEVLTKGLGRLDGRFFTYSMRGVLGDGGGAYHAIMGTLLITLIATIIAVPVGIMAAIYLVEYGKTNRLARALTFFVDVMTGIPSIVAGLFAYSFFVLFMGEGARAGIIGATALVVLMLPVVVRNTEEMLRIVPNELREAAYALGVPKWLTIVKVVLPTSIAGIATGVTLAIARIIGETAPLLVTVGITTGVNLNPFSQRMATLPVFAYYQYATPGVPPEPYIDRAWTASLVLILIVMTLNVIARLISRYFAPKGAR